MMTEQKNKQQRLITVTMENLVPQDHFLRHLESVLNTDFIYDLARPLYSRRGRPSIDPVTLVKMLLIGYLYGINSERKLEKEIQVNIAYRWYLGLDLEDEIPDHSTLSQNRRRRFKGTTVFEDIFLKVVHRCIDAGLVSGEAIAMDSTHVRANANNDKRENVTVVSEPREYLKRLEAEVARKNAERLGEKKHRGHSPKGTSGLHITEETKSTTDPDSGLLGRPGKPNGFHYLFHQSADVECGIITDVHVTAGNRLDHECCVERIKVQRDKLQLPIKQFVADKGYDINEIHHMLGEMGIAVFTPMKLPHEGWRRNELASRQFVYDKENDIFHCPGGHNLHFSFYTREHENLFSVYSSRALECRECPFRQDCFSKTKKTRRIKRAYNAEYTEASRKHIGSEQYKYLLRRRKIVCEGNFANMKDNGNLRRTRKLGLDNAFEHCLLCAIALNLKKLIKYKGNYPPKHLHILCFLLVSIKMKKPEEFSLFGLFSSPCLSTAPQ